ncbi:T9SS type A sorting domain-containing protein [Lutimonas saemankumensis]|uniref:T9SS type A sorting domain-containing protein n=1 Tax=Lutimonas saemankumensis TaxID=483016 RepID=UPI001CD6AA11|nr:T9SS type A sorting domain-containing protein [Lutimonas saemankumensis]MCA0932566.1 T9SS type A sorting domain-containing protein [Lutimonas saemankumensis]
MKLKLRFPFIYRFLLVQLTMLICVPSIEAQQLYVGSEGLFYLPNNVIFTTSNTIVEVDDNGNFIVGAGSNWGSSLQYVNGKVKALGSGTSVLPVGDNGVYAPVSMEHTTDVTARYFNSAPTSGTNGTDVDAVSDVEYWKLSGTAVVTLPYNENSDITSLVNNNGGSLNSLSIVGIKDGIWNLISDSNTSVVSGDLLNGDVSSDVSVPVVLEGFEEFTFGIDHQIVLAVDDLFDTTGISIRSNPILSGKEAIEFTTSGDLLNLKASIFDINGRLLKHYDQIELFGNQGSLSKSGLGSGLYFLKFEHEGKQGVKKIIIE